MDPFAERFPLPPGPQDVDEQTPLVPSSEISPPSNQDDARASGEGIHLIGLAVPLVSPPPRLRERLMARIHQECLEADSKQSHQVWKQWERSSGDLHVVRDGEAEWQNVREGIRAKQLFVDPARDMATMLIRMEPGTAYVPHRHAGPEQCFVLEGDLHDGEQVYRKGDFQCAAEGSTHGVQWTEQGCTLLIVSSLHDQLI